jgi:prepilin-type processing-associated H-X9-DG protein
MVAKSARHGGCKVSAFSIWNFREIFDHMGHSVNEEPPDLACANLLLEAACRHQFAYGKHNVCYLGGHVSSSYRSCPSNLSHATH